MQILKSIKNLLVDNNNTSNAKVDPLSTAIASGAVFSGDLISENDIWVYGEVKGNVSSGENVYIKPGGVIRGDIKSTTANISGEVIGNIDCQDKVVCKEGARINGNIKSQDILVEKGASISGNVDIMGVDKSSEEEE
ncbi:MAG: polymer-forming cytoskeletal protein [Candidatus Saccharimonadales bacterium]